MRRWFLLFFLCIPLFALAQQEMEIIPLRHRTMDQVIPALRPLIEPGGTLTGMGDQLIVRASRRNLEQIRQALAVIDRPARRLVIRVSQSRESESRRQASQVSGDVHFGNNVRIIQPGTASPDTAQVEVRSGGSTVRIQGGESQKSRESQSVQSVQVIEGGQAMIRVGRSIPLPFRQLVQGPQGTVVSNSVVYQDVGQGFVAVPQLSGERVTLEISPVFDSMSGRGYGNVETQRLSTTVSGRLGEWMELGGSSQQVDNRGRTLSGIESNATRDARSVWLLVEELP